MFPRTCSGSLYRALEIEQDASSQDVKKAYYRLALRLHPDKNGGATTEQFRIIQEAQEILSDSKQRQVYDTFGKSGVEAFRHFGDAGMLMNPTSICSGCIAAAFWMFLLMLTLVLVIIRLDYDRNWSWPVVFSPLWVSFFPLLLLGVLLLRNGIVMRDMFSVLFGCECLIIIIASAMLVGGLSGRLAWTSALAPSVGLYVLMSCHTMCHLIPSQFRRLYGEVIQPGASIFASQLYWLVLFNILFEKTLVFSFLVLALLRAAQADKGISKLLSFWWVFAPLIMYFGGILLFNIVHRLFARTLRETHGICNRLYQIIAVFFIYGGPLFTVCMLAAKCEVELNHVRGGLHPSTALALLPLEILLTLGILIFSFMAYFSEKLLEQLAAAEVRDDSEVAPLNRSGLFGRNTVPQWERSSEDQRGNGGVRAEGPVTSSIGETNTEPCPSTEYRAI